jgi:hypothetical protein
LKRPGDATVQLAAELVAAKVTRQPVETVTAILVAHGNGDPRREQCRRRPRASRSSIVVTSLRRPVLVSSTHELARGGDPMTGQTAAGASTRLEDLQAGLRLSGLLPQTVSILAVTAHGSDAVTVTFQDARQTAEINLLISSEKLRARLDRPFNVEELTADLKNETFLAAHP